MAPKGKSSTGRMLKQGTLHFSSAKRGSTAGKTKASPTVTSARKPQSAEKKHQGSRAASISSTISVNTSSTDSTSEEEVVLVTPPAEQRIAKRRKTETGQAKSIGEITKPVRKAPKDDSDLSSDEEPGNLNVLQKEPRIQRLYNQAKTRMGDVPPVHAEGQNKIHHILRVFDTSYEYGPCVGITRLQRWERAHALGLNPPNEVREILTTKQGLEDDAYKECVFYDEL